MNLSFNSGFSPRRLSGSAAMLAATVFALPVFAGVVPANFTESEVASGIHSPAGMDFAPDGRLFLGGQKGHVHVIVNDTLRPTKVLNIQAKTDYNTERGLQTVVLDPDFATNGYIYVFYTALLPAPHNRVSRFTVVNNVADTTETVILTLPNLPARASFGCINVDCNGTSNGLGTTTLSVWHMGGGMTFGADGKLYVGVGDHEVLASAQSTTSLFGKILRINKDGTIPSDNPFYGTYTGDFRMIYASGVRSPFVLTLQPGTGRIFFTDVGDVNWEEVDTLSRGGNYGWSTCEGAFVRNQPTTPCTNASFISPIFAYRHGTTNFTGLSSIGGAFAKNFRTQDNGKYFFADFNNSNSAIGWIKSINPVTGGDTTIFATGYSNITGIQFNPSGNALYVMARGYSTGTIDTVGTANRISRVYKIAYNGGTSVRGLAPSQARAQSTLLTLDVHRSIRVPQHATAVRFYDLSGRQLFTAQGLIPGSDISVPTGMASGIVRALWE